MAFNLCCSSVCTRLRLQLLLLFVVMLLGWCRLITQQRCCCIECGL
jgi:hypothetical protein